MTGFCSRLLDARKQAGLSQAELARKARISASYLNRIEKGERRPPGRAVVLRIVESLELDVETTDELLLSAGYAPVRHSEELEAHPVVGLVADMLQAGYVPDEEVDLLQRQIELIRRRWEPTDEE